MTATATENQNTENTEDIEETPKVDLERLAKSGEIPYLTQVWPQISKDLKGLKKQSEDLKKFTPPNQVDLMKFIQSDEGKADEVISKAQAEINKLNETINKLREREYARAKELMKHEELPAEELTKLRESFSEKRTAVVNQIDAFRLFAQAMHPELVPAFDAIQIPRFTHGLGGTSSSGAGAVRDPEVAELRAWAKENGIEVPERGRIKAEIWEKFRNSKKASK